MRRFIVKSSDVEQIANGILHLLDIYLGIVGIDAEAVRALIQDTDHRDRITVLDAAGCNDKDLI